MHPLAGMTNLSLKDTRITDAGLLHLSAMLKLDVIDLQGTPVTPEGIASLKRAVPTLRVVLAGR